MMIGMAVTLGAANKKFTLVIDAGHGGHDAGAIGTVAKEKDLTLKFALAFGKLVEQNCPDVKVIYTRKTDKFVELIKRADIANDNKADLFISVHINSMPKGRTVHGFQTYTLGKSRKTGKKNGVQENLEVAKRENAVIYLEKNYKQTYHGFDPNSAESNIIFDFVQDKNMENSIELAKYMQRYVCQATGRKDMGAHQDNLAVLRLTSMPGCLIELGFISTRDEEKFMNSKEATAKYARGIYNAFAAYKKRYGGSVAVPYLAEPQAESKPKPEETAKPQTELRAEPKEEPRPVVQPEEKLEEQPVAQPESLSEPQPEPQPEVKAEPLPEPQPVAQPAAPVFKVQILIASKVMKSGDSRLKGLTDIDYYQENGMIKYTTGASTNYQEIYALRKRVLDKFPEAFIVAFRQGAKMDVQEAIKEYKANKAKR